jgi:hypothetical protein
VKSRALAPLLKGARSRGPWMLGSQKANKLDTAGRVARQHFKQIPNPDKQMIQQIQKLLLPSPPGRWTATPLRKQGKPKGTYKILKQTRTQHSKVMKKFGSKNKLSRAPPCIQESL